MVVFNQIQFKLKPKPALFSKLLNNNQINCCDLLTQGFESFPKRCFLCTWKVIRPSLGIYRSSFTFHPDLAVGMATLFEQ